MLRALALVSFLVAFVVAQDFAGQQRDEGTTLEKRSAEEPQTLAVEEEVPSSRAKRQWGYGGYGGYGYQPYGGYGGGYGGYGGYGPQRTVIIKKVIIGGGSPFYGK